MNLNFFKVNTLPTILEPHSFYFVSNGSYAESYLTDSNGNYHHIGNSKMIAEVATSSINLVKFYENIEARDIDLPNLSSSIILVKDASDDVDVNSGAAMYWYDVTTQTFNKIAEYESVDVTLEWDVIIGRPSSTPVVIDAAVSLVNTHDIIVSKISEVDGNPCYEGVSFQHWSTVEW